MQVHYTRCTRNDCCRYDIEKNPNDDAHDVNERICDLLSVICCCKKHCPDQLHWLGFPVKSTFTSFSLSTTKKTFVTTSPHKKIGTASYLHVLKMSELVNSFQQRRIDSRPFKILLSLNCWEKTVKNSCTTDRQAATVCLRRFQALPLQRRKEFDKNCI